MIWIICLIVSLSVLALAVLLACVAAAGRFRRLRIPSPFKLFFGGFFLSVVIMLVPIYYSDLCDVTNRILKTVSFSIHNTFQIFTIDADRDIIVEKISGSETALAAVYSGILSVVYVIAPVMTFGFLVSFFRNLSAHARYILGYFRKNVCVFSELNEKSLSLASDIKKNRRGTMIVFTDVFEQEEESSYELIDGAHGIRAICFKKSVLAVNFGFHLKGAEISFYTVSGDETENIIQAQALIERYRQRNNTRLFVFSSGAESEMLLTNADFGVLKVRRINEARARVYRILYDRGPELFSSAVPDGDLRRVGAVVVGMGLHGTEMVKALSWYCQMDGYSVEIDAFDSDSAAEDRFTAAAPELMDPAYNGVRIPGEAEYTIRIHSGYDVTTKKFADAIRGLTGTTYVFVCLGSDELNIRTAANLRMLFERAGVKPAIQAILYNKDAVAALNGITNYRGQPYNIDFISGGRSSRSEDMIFNPELEDEALKRHLKWGKEDEFWKYEYNYNSSVASALHFRARVACGIPGAGKKEEELTEEEKTVIETLEHRRWNAYMRSEGYVYSGSPEKSSRNDLGKMHNDLVDYSSLDEDEKRKDSRIGTD